MESLKETAGDKNEINAMKKLKTSYNQKLSKMIVEAINKAKNSEAGIIFFAWQQSQFKVLMMMMS